MQRDNAAWLTDLRSTGEQQENALNDLREILMRILPKALSRWLTPEDPLFEPFIEDTAQETLLRVLDRLDTFENRSKFTTWVYSIAVRIGLSELRRRKWQEVSLDALETDSHIDKNQNLNFTMPGNSPELSTAQANTLTLVITAMEEKLTPYQFKVMAAVFLQGIPLDVLTQRMDKSRNTLYKVMHDARLKLKQHLEDNGHPPHELLDLFNN